MNRCHEMQRITVNRCGRLVSLLWLNGALVSLSEIQETIENQKSRRESQRVSARTERNEDSTAGGVAVWLKSDEKALRCVPYKDVPRGAEELAHTGRL